MNSLGFPILSLITLMPILCAVVVLFIPNEKVDVMKKTVIGFMGVNLLLTLFMFAQYNVSEGGMAFGTDPVMAERVTSAVKKITSKPVMIKLSPNVTDITEIARAVAGAVFLARHHKTKEQIRTYLRQYYPLDFRLEDIRDSYQGDATCEGSVPQALEAFLEAESFEDALRGAVSIGGDSDTIASMAGAVAAAFYGIPRDIRDQPWPTWTGRSTPSTTGSAGSIEEAAPCGTPPCATLSGRGSISCSTG